MERKLKRVLVVEDEAILAMMVEDMLSDAGYEVVGPAPHLDAAMSLARDADFDVAILDMNLAGRNALPVAEVIRGRGKPFVFATGYGAAADAPGYEDVATVAKPFTMEDIGKAFAELA